MKKIVSLICLSFVVFFGLIINVNAISTHTDEKKYSFSYDEYGISFDFYSNTKTAINKNDILVSREESEWGSHGGLDSIRSRYDIINCYEVNLENIVSSYATINFTITLNNTTDIVKNDIYYSSVGSSYGSFIEGIITKNSNSVTYDFSTSDSNHIYIFITKLKDAEELHSITDSKTGIKVEYYGYEIEDTSSIFSEVDDSIFNDTFYDEFDLKTSIKYVLPYNYIDGDKLIVYIPKGEGETSKYDVLGYATKILHKETVTIDEQEYFKVVTPDIYAEFILVDIKQKDRFNGLEDIKGITKINGKYFITLNSVNLYNEFDHEKCLISSLTSCWDYNNDRYFETLNSTNGSLYFELENLNSHLSYVWYDENTLKIIYSYQSDYPIEVVDVDIIYSGEDELIIKANTFLNSLKNSYHQTELNTLSLLLNNKSNYLIHIPEFIKDFNKNNTEGFKFERIEEYGMGDSTPITYTELHSYSGNIEFVVKKDGIIYGYKNVEYSTDGFISVDKNASGSLETRVFDRLSKTLTENDKSTLEVQDELACQNACDKLTIEDVKQNGYWIYPGACTLENAISECKKECTELTEDETDEKGNVIKNRVIEVRGMRIVSKIYEVDTALEENYHLELIDYSNGSSLETASIDITPDSILEVKDVTSESVVKSISSNYKEEIIQASQVNLTCLEGYNYIKDAKGNTVLTLYLNKKPSKDLVKITEVSKTGVFVNEYTGKVILLDGKYYAQIEVDSFTNNYIYLIFGEENTTPTLININSLTINNISNLIYTGKALTPELTIKDEEYTLVKGTDYTVSYKNNTNVGTATITIKGKGNYTGTTSVTFKIVVGNPSGLKSTSQSTTSVTLSWTKASGSVTGYIIYRSLDNKTWTKVGTVSYKTLSYTDKSLTSGKKYYYKVKAYKTISSKNYYSSYSEIITTATKVVAPKITKYTSNTTSIKVTYGKVSGASGYAVYASTDNKTWIKLGETTELSYTHSGLTEGKTYYYKVRAYKKVNETNVYGSYSKVGTYSTKPVKATITKTVNSASYITVTWEKVYGAKYYQVSYSSDNKTWTTKTVKNSVTSLKISGLKSGKTYYIKVRAYKLVGSTKIYGSYSEAKVMTTKPDKVMVNKVIPTKNSVTLSWMKVSGATSYEVWYTDTLGGEYTLLTTTKSTKYVHTELESKKTYYYKVRAIRTLEETDYKGAYSMVLEATTLK